MFGEFDVIKIYRIVTRNLRLQFITENRMRALNEMELDRWIYFHQ